MNIRIEHIGIYTADLERLRAFYAKYFGAVSGEKYENDDGFSSYFLTLPGGGARIELMSHTRLLSREIIDKINGISHIALSVGSREAVISLTDRLKADGYRINLPARLTGDGYFESNVADPDGNAVEITE